MTINTKKGTFFKDRATAEEIINQLEKNLIVEMSSNSGKSPVGEKSRTPEKSLTKNEPTKPPRSSSIGLQKGISKKGPRPDVWCLRSGVRGRSISLLTLNLDP